VIACISVALIAALVLGRLFGIEPGVRRLLAAGTAICGCTAIIAVAPVVHAHAAAAGMFFGASVQDTSQVVGAALIYDQQFGEPDVVAVAGLTKFMRTFGLIVLVPAAAMWMMRSAANDGTARPQGLRQGALPWFVIVFIALVFVRTLGDVWVDGPAWQRTLALAQQASELLLLCGMAAVGLGITFVHLREAGWRPLAVAFLAASATGLTALALLHL
jgi:uncharacterized membrane protein YadS